MKRILSVALAAVLAGCGGGGGSGGGGNVRTDTARPQEVNTAIYRTPEAMRKSLRKIIEGVSVNPLRRDPVLGEPGVAPRRDPSLDPDLYPDDPYLPMVFRSWGASTGTPETGTGYGGYGAWLDYSMFGAFSAGGTGISTGYYEGYEGVARERPEITATYTGDMIGVVDFGGRARHKVVHGKALLEYSIDTNEVTAKFSGIRYVDNVDRGGPLDFEAPAVSVGEDGTFGNMVSEAAVLAGCVSGCVEGGFYGPGAPESAGRFVKVYEGMWPLGGGKFYTWLRGGFGVKRE